MDDLSLKREPAGQQAKARLRCGFSLVELLVVLAILAVLAIAGTAALGPRGSAQTRTLLDDLEGTLLSATKLAVATSQDVTLVARGNWDAAASPRLSLCRVTGLAPTSSQITAQQGQAETFQVSVRPGPPPSLGRSDSYAGIAAATGTGNDWWAMAMRQDAVTHRTNQDINTVQPFLSQTGFQGLLAATNPSLNLFQGGATPTQATISGTSKRFMSTFYIQVVGLRGGRPYPGSPMGLLVVQNNGGTVYKFYNPGVLNGDGLWRRL